MTQLNFVRTKAPITEEVIKSLNLYDVVFLTGRIFIFRDQSHIKALKTVEREQLPFSLKDEVIWHCGPIMKKESNNSVLPLVECSSRVTQRWKAVSAGSTTSWKMNDIEILAMEKLGFNVVIGKGGLNRKVADYMKEHNCCYLSTLGGCGVILAEAIKEIKNVYWREELGDTEAVWELKVENFGPLIVGIDAKGNTLYEG